MPQKLSRVKPDTRTPIFGGFALLKDVDLDGDLPLVLDFALIVAFWSQIEARLGRFLAQLLGASADIGVAMYTALHGTSAQMHLLDAAAAAVLKDADDLELFRAIMDLTRSAAKERSRMVHGVWGLSEDMPDSLLLVSQQDLIAHEGQSAALKHWIATLTEPTEPGQLFAGPTPPPLPRGASPDSERVYVYRRSDFRDVRGFTVRITFPPFNFRGHPPRNRVSRIA